MNKNYLVIFAIIAMLVAGCASVPVRDVSVDSEADPKANFSTYKTYAWLGAAAILNDSMGRWEPPSFDVDSEVKFLIDRELRKRGMSESSTEPDLIVVFALGVDMDAMALKEDPATRMEMLHNVPKGGLVIALVDHKSGFVAWVGVATADVLKNPTDQTVKARLDYAVTHLLERVPK